MELWIEDYGLFFLLALLAEIIGTVSGFGSSILFVPLASLFFDFTTVLGITAVFHVFSNLAKIYLFREGLDKKIAFRLGLPAVLFVIIGAILTRYISRESGELIMNIVLLLLALVLIFFSSIKINPSNKNLVIGGIASGFLAGLIGTGGAVRGLTLMAFNLEKSIYIATSAFIDFGVDSSRAIVYIYNGFFTYAEVRLIPFLIIISIIGSWVGKLLLGHVPQVYFKYIVLIVIIATCIYNISRVFYS